MDISARLRSLMQQKGLSLTALAERSGLAISSISRYRSGKQEPGAAALARLAAALEVPMGELTGSLAGSPLSLTQQLLVHLEELKHTLLKEELSRKEQVSGVQDSGAGASLPLYSRIPGSKGAAPVGRFLAPSDVLDTEAFALKISDDVNSPRLQVGDVAVFSPATSWKSEDVCVVVFRDGSGFIGKVHRRGKRLALSKVRTPKLSRRVSSEDVKAIHKLVWIKSC